MNELVSLRDGSQVVIRPVQRDDEAKLLAGFRALSPESRYRRFLSPTSRLDSKWVRYFTDVDHHSHEALIAQSPAGEPVGIARFIRSVEEPTAAEIAVTVVDDWHGRGAGTALLTLLAARAREEGVRKFRATCLAENREMRDMIRGFAPSHSESTANGLVEIELALPVELDVGNELHAALRHAAAGAVRFAQRAPRSASNGSTPRSER